MKTIQLPDMYQLENGVLIIYLCGTKRFISNSWYDDIDTNNL
jgi:hypothetical protein